MKKFNIMAVALATSMVLASTTVFADATVSFTDMPADETTKTAITNAVKNGILSGYEDNTVRPSENITRAQMASIITRACVVSKEGDISEYTDVSSDKWYYSAMAKAFEMGAFNGDDQKHMNPENNITFQECFTVLSQVFDLLPAYQIHVEEADVVPSNDTYFDASKNRLYDISCLGKFKDANNIATWAKVYYAGVVSNNGWNGIDGNLTPANYITRGQFAVVMNNLIQNYIDTPGIYNVLPEGNTMIRCNDVTIDGASGNIGIYIADCVESGKVTLNNLNIDRLVVRGCTLKADEDSTIAPIGIYKKIRIIRPNIILDLQQVENADVSTYSVPKSQVFFGSINF